MKDLLFVHKVGHLLRAPPLLKPNSYEALLSNSVRFCSPARRRSSIVVRLPRIISTWSSALWQTKVETRLFYCFHQDPDQWLTVHKWETRLLFTMASPHSPCPEEQNTWRTVLPVLVVLQCHTKNNQRRWQEQYEIFVWVCTSGFLKQHHLLLWV